MKLDFGWNVAFAESTGFLGLPCFYFCSFLFSPDFLRYYQSSRSERLCNYSIFYCHFLLFETYTLKQFFSSLDLKKLILAPKSPLGHHPRSQTFISSARFISPISSQSSVVPRPFWEGLCSSFYTVNCLSLSSSVSLNHYHHSWSGPTISIS